MGIGGQLSQCKVKSGFVKPTRLLSLTQQNRPPLRAVLSYASDETELRLLFAASRFLRTRSGFRRFMTRAAFAVFRCVFFGVVHRLFSIGGTFSYIGRKEILFKKMFEIKKAQGIKNT